jgi:hypothetical protein
MNRRLGLWAVILVGFAAAIAVASTGTAETVQAPQAGARPAIGAPGSGRLSNADQRRFDALAVEHRTTRGRLPPDERTDLDRLSARVRDTPFAAAPRGDAWQAAKAVVRAAIPGLSDNEVGTFAAYALDGIVAGDLAVLQFAKTNPPFDVLMGFNQQYLQLQSQMQNENRSFAAISNIMKTKHDTVKNSISNVR